MSGYGTITVRFCNSDNCKCKARTLVHGLADKGIRSRKVPAWRWPGDATEV